MNFRWPRFVTPTFVSQIIRQQKNLAIALQIFNAAKTRDPRYKHNGPVYATMINALASSRRFTEMKSVIEQMKNDSCECKDWLFASIIKTYANAGLIDEALALFYRIPDFNCVKWDESFNALLQLLVEQGKVEIAHSFYLSNSKKSKVKLETRSLNILIRAVCARNRSDLALEIFEEMSEQCCFPDGETYSVLMKGLCEDQRLEEATHLLYSMFRRISTKGCGADVVVYRTLLEALCDQGKVQEAVKLLGQVLKKGLNAPKRRRNLHLSELTAHVHDKGRLGDVKGLINKMLVKGGSPSLASYSAMTADLYSVGRIEEADQLFDEMFERGFRPPVEIYNAKISALCREGRAGEGAMVLDQMVKDRAPSSLTTYNLVILGLCKEGKSLKAVGYMHRMARRHVGGETYRILVDGLCAEGHFVEAASVMEKMVDDKRHFPCDTTYDNLINGLCLQGRKYEALLWLEEMVSQGITPAACVWNALVTACVGDEQPNLDARALLPRTLMGGLFVQH